MEAILRSALTSPVASLRIQLAHGCLPMRLGRATLDDGTERVIAYPSEHDVPINALPFRVFANGAEQLIGRAWLIDPIRAQVSSATTPDDPSELWDGEICGSFGHEIPYAVHTGPLHTGLALSGVRGLFEDLAPFSGGVAPQSFGLLDHGAARAGLLVCGDAEVEDSPLAPWPSVLSMLILYLYVPDDLLQIIPVYPADTFLALLPSLM